MHPLVRRQANRDLRRVGLQSIREAERADRRARGDQKDVELESIGSDYTTTTSVRPGHRVHAVQGLADLQGNPVKIHTTSAKVELRLTRLKLIPSW